MDLLCELSGGPYVLVEREQVVRVVARLEVLEPRVVGAICVPHAAFFFALHDTHVVAVLVHRECRFQRLNPLTGGSLAIGRFPIGCDVAAYAILAQGKRRRIHGHSRYCAMQMNEEAIDREPRAQECLGENLDSAIIQLPEKAAEMFLIAWWNIRWYHLLKLEIRS